MKGPCRTVALLVTLLTAPAVVPAQGIPLSSLSGRIVSEGGDPLAGVVVSTESASLQGRRETTSHASGEYVLPFLPPGAYVVLFSLPGMQGLEKTITLNAAVGGRLDVAMRPAPVEASITVSADALAGTPLETTQVASTYKQSLVNQLPLDRSLRSVTLLAPGVTDNGPNGNIGSANPASPALVISGAQSFESLYMVDGAVVNENLRGQPQSLYIEDAIQETTVLTGSVSAEYGRFTGGVVNVVTRSGGNEHHGTFRTSFTSDAWRSLSRAEEIALEDPRLDEVDEAYEATLGGPVLRDRIWFFAAGRRQASSDSREIFVPGDTQDSGDDGSLFVPYTHSVSDDRAEAKLTGNVNASHNLVAAYTWERSTETNRGDPTLVADLSALDSFVAPAWFLTLNYNGILSSRFSVEAQYSERHFTIEGAGSPYADFVRGSAVYTDRGLLNSPAGYQGYPEDYGNRGWFARGSYFVSTDSLGTHEVRLGYEWFDKTVRANFAFSGSGFILQNGVYSIVRDNQIYPVFQNVVPGHPEITPAQLESRPIDQTSLGDDFLTQSAYFDDRIRLGARVTIDLGVRYDVNDARNPAGRSVSVSGTWSPRLAAQVDVSGRGTVLVNAGYARYVAGLHEGIVQLFSEAGQPDLLDRDYTGPCINCDPNAPTSQLLTTPEALAIVNQWYQTVGMGLQPTNVRIQGHSRIVPTDGLVSPTATEYSAGVGLALGSKGWARADYVYRNYDRFYDDRIDLGTGQYASPQYGQLDVDVLENSPILDRRYEAVQTRVDYRFSPAIYAGLSYTWSRLTGNAVGENDAVSAAPDHASVYPEYLRPSWSYPTGYLPGDQRNRVRFWLGTTVPVSFGSVGASVLESYASGLPYEASTDQLSLVGPSGAYVVNPGYAQPPTSGTYFFSARGAFRMPSVSSTDIAVTVTARLFGDIDVFVQPQILNVFNQQGVLAVNTLVDLRQPFNPYTQKPIRGVNYELDSKFGTPTAYQSPRSFRFSVGLRF